MQNKLVRLHILFSAMVWFACAATADISAAVENGSAGDVAEIAGANNQIAPQLKIMLPGDVPMEFVTIKPGSFDMGSKHDPPWSQASEMPLHHVQFSSSFNIGKYEVTQAQWHAVMHEFPGGQPKSDPGLPVVFVSWEDCQRFLSALNALNCGEYRLPSEAEWEYACRGGSYSRWSFGDDQKQLRDYAWFIGNNPPPTGTKVVGKKLPNGFGLFDMEGNVWEWVQDPWHENYDGAPTDGSTWQDQADGVKRVLRGGAYHSAAVVCRPAARNNDNPESRDASHGLRVVRIK